MSLDVYLVIPGKDREIFNSFEVSHLTANFAIAREKGYKGSYNEWFSGIDPDWRKIANIDNPDYEEQTEDVYWANITHNLGEMAEKAGIYEALWRPYQLLLNYVPNKDHKKEFEFERSQEIKANFIIPYLEKGLEKLKADPEYFEKFNSPNGWGLYKNFVPFVEKYLEACKEYPNAKVEVSR